MDYRLEYLDSTKFEQLVNAICQTILGTGVVEFSVGKDGGRDGKFTGKANNYPGIQNSWSGKFIIQAKHTMSSEASCSDNEFEKIIDTEIIKIKNLKELGDIDNYMLFTNRKYSAIKGEALLKKIRNETGLENVALIGKETINNQYINPNRGLIKQFELDKHHIPFDFSSEEIKEIIISFKTQISTIEESLKEEVEKVKYDFERISLEEKNIKNGLSKDYFENVIVSGSLTEFQKIKYFLSDPINVEFKDYFLDTASELNQIITVKRDEFDLFDQIFVFIYQKICDGNSQLLKSKRHVLMLLHFMYAECLIGKK